MKDYDVTAARGFIDLFGLPMKVRGMKQRRSTEVMHNAQCTMHNQDSANVSCEADAQMQAAVSGIR